MIVKISEELKKEASELVDLDKKFLVVQTIQDGFTGTYEGNHIYQIRKGIATDTTAVYPTVWDTTNKKWIVDPFTEETVFPSIPLFDNEPKYNPIITAKKETSGDFTIKGVSRTFTDPYNNRGVSVAEIGKSITNAEGEANKILLQMFIDFAVNEFRIGHYNLFITDEITTDDSDMTPVDPSKPATKVEFSKSTDTLKVGAKAKVVATITPSDSTDTIGYTSDKPAIVSVDSTGEYTAVSEGSAVITGKAGTATAKLTVTVEATE